MIFDPNNITSLLQQEVELMCGVDTAFTSCEWEHNGNIYQVADIVKGNYHNMKSMSNRTRNQCGVVIRSLESSDSGVWACRVLTNGKYVTQFKTIYQIEPRCPVGLFKTSGSSQCYRFYNDTERAYISAKEKCKAEGLELAEPANPIAVRKYLVENYGQTTTAYAWLGACSTGSYFRWERSGHQISNSDSLWCSGHPGTNLATKYSLILLAEKNTYLANQPNAPYYSQSNTAKHYTLCEYV